MFLRAELFTPLGMTRTRSTPGCSDRAEGLPSGYEVVLGFAVAVPEMPGTCAAGACATPVRRSPPGTVLRRPGRRRRDHRERG
ncbi:hypothetical protein [Micromonospora wenchangensis]|uniref:hypothetical protein n=1 Tax=Micromonospora wenchangensis TaxID=1185415 RepID=UPI003814801F